MKERNSGDALGCFFESRWFLLILRVVIGGVFLYAGYLKIREPAAFAYSLASFRIFPDSGINRVVTGLPSLEILLGVMLVTGWRVREASFGALLLSLIFAFALGQALLRGIQVDCGCFGSGNPSAMKTLLGLGRDVLLIAASSWLWVNKAEK